MGLSRWAATAALVAVVGAAAPAVAQRSAIVLSAAGDAVDATVIERARSGVIEVLAERALRLIPTPDGAPCAEVECATQLAASAAADVVLLVEVRAADVRITAVRAEGLPRERVEPIGAPGPAAAAGAALEALLDAEPPSARTGFLLVTTDPPGAEVWIDGERAGPAPLRRSVASGEHTVRLTRRGRDPIERTVEVEEGREASLEIDLDAREGEGEGEDDGEDTEVAAPSPSASEPSPWNWVLGGGLAIAGIVSLISPLTTLAQLGTCVDRIEDVGCVEQVQLGAQSGVLMGLGLALLVSAVVVDAVAPIRVDVAVSESAARVTVEGRF